MFEPVSPFVEEITICLTCIRLLTENTTTQQGSIAFFERIHIFLFKYSQKTISAHLLSLYPKCFKVISKKLIEFVFNPELFLITLDVIFIEYTYLNRHRFFCFSFNGMNYIHQLVHSRDLKKNVLSSRVWICIHLCKGKPPSDAMCIRLLSHILSQSRKIQLPF